MKLIDKHILRTFAVPLVYCLAAFVLVYVIYDLFDNLPDFIQAKTPLMQVVKFYFLLMPSVLVFIVPVSLLLATLYSLSQLTKNNELTAMRASGVSLYRLMVPFMVVGFVSSMLVSSVHETIGPWSAYWTDQFVSAQRHKGEFNVYIAHNLGYMNTGEKRTWFIGQFDTRTFDMQNIKVTQEGTAEEDPAEIHAKKGLWLDGRWWFVNVTTQTYDMKGHPRGAPSFDRRKEMFEFEETPQDFINARKDVRQNPEQFSSREYVEYLRTHPGLSSDTIARIRVDFHQRLAMPWTCFVVTLLGIPFGAQTGRKGAFVGVTLSLGLFFSLYILINLGIALGKKELMDPWLAAWAPNMLFTAFGLALIHRMR